MFENLLAQQAGQQLIEDIRSSSLPGALLFSGPLASGKATAALELARVLSCEGSGVASSSQLSYGEWNCPCSACERHRHLNHPDLLMMGRRDFSNELRASAATLMRENTPTTRFLFLRSLEKLLARFSPILWEGEEQKLNKAVTSITEIRELLEDLEALTEAGTEYGKILDKLLERAIKLESTALPAQVPLSWIRNAHFWARSTAFGRHKLILIEQVERLQEGSRNALLKLLEEPPERCTLVLTTTRRHAVMQTILSRLRSYPFLARSLEDELKVVRRVFKDTSYDSAETTFPGLALWLEDFSSVSSKDISGLAKIFILALFDEIALHHPKRKNYWFSLLGGSLQEMEGDVQKMGLPLAESSANAIQFILTKTGKFEPRSLYSRFLTAMLESVSPLLRQNKASPVLSEVFSSLLSLMHSSENAVITYNQSPPQALEALFFDLFSLFSSRAPLRSSKCVPL